MRYELNLKSEEITLILSALQWDNKGTWGDGREEAIKELMSKIQLQTRWGK